jgi:hypothetical protein
MGLLKRGFPWVYLSAHLVGISHLLSAAISTITTHGITGETQSGTASISTTTNRIIT